MKVDRYLAILLVAALIYTVLVLELVSGFQSLPSPIFGGDYYFQMGCIHHMYGSSFLEWFSSCNGLGSMPGYLPLYGIAVTIFGKLTGLDPMHAMLYSNLLWPLLSLLAFYLLLKRIVNDSAISAIGSLVLVGFTVFPILRYTEFTRFIIVPLFLLCLFNFFREQSRKNAALLGVAYAAMGLAHSTSFIYASFMVVAVFAYLLYSRRDEGLQNAAKGLSVSFALAFGIGFLASLILWFEPIFVHHGQSALKNGIFAFPDTARADVMFKILFSGLGSMFFNTGNLLAFAVSILSLAGTYWLFKKGKDPEHGFLKFAFIATFLFTYSYFITSPFLDLHFVPTHSISMYLYPIAAIIGLVFLRDYSEGKEKVRMYAVAGLAALILINLVPAYPSWHDGKWMQAGRTPLMPKLLWLQSYLLANTSVDDVILSNNELSFSANAVSGRKLMVSRRSQNDPFVDFDQRELDAAIILYGTDLETRLSLIKEYNISYFYYDSGWTDLEFDFEAGEQGYIPVSYFDPLLMIYSFEREIELKKNGVEYSHFKGFLDPTIKGEDIRQFDLLLVDPSNYHAWGKGMWNDEIDPYLKEVWRYEENGEMRAVLYRVEA